MIAALAAYVTAHHLPALACSLLVVIHLGKPPAYAADTLWRHTHTEATGSGSSNAIALLSKMNEYPVAKFLKWVQIPQDLLSEHLKRRKLKPGRNSESRHWHLPAG